MPSGPPGADNIRQLASSLQQEFLEHDRSSTNSWVLVLGSGLLFFCLAASAACRWVVLARWPNGVDVTAESSRCHYRQSRIVSGVRGSQASRAHLSPLASAGFARGCPEFSCEQGLVMARRLHPLGLASHPCKTPVHKTSRAWQCRRGDLRLSSSSQSDFLPALGPWRRANASPFVPVAGEKESPPKGVRPVRYGLGPDQRQNP